MTTAAVESRPDRAAPARDRLACSPTNRPKSAPSSPAASPRRRSNAARACPAGALLVRISASETSAQLLEAEANAGQIEARLGLAPGSRSTPSGVPEVMNAQASLDLAEAEFRRIQSLLDQKVVSQSEWEQRRTQVEAARQQYKVALNVAEQSYRSLQAARARVALANKSLADTAGPRAVRRPRRRARGQRRRLRHQGRPRRHRRQHRSASRRADRAGAGDRADQGRSAGAPHGRRLPGRGVHRHGALRVAVGPRRSARADRRSDRAEQGRPAQARALCDRVDSAGRGRRRR